MPTKCLGKGELSAPSQAIFGRLRLEGLVRIAWIHRPRLFGFLQNKLVIPSSRWFFEGFSNSQKTRINGPYVTWPAIYQILAPLSHCRKVPLAGCSSCHLKWRDCVHQQPALGSQSRQRWMDGIEYRAPVNTWPILPGTLNNQFLNGWFNWIPYQYMKTCFFSKHP